MILLKKAALLQVLLANPHCVEGSFSAHGDHEQASDEEMESKAMDSLKVPDPNYIEMIQSIKSQVSDTLIPPPQEDYVGL